MNTQHAAEKLASWLARTNPALFDALAQRAAEVGTPGARAANMSGIWDTLKTIGGHVGSAVKGVGSFLTSQEGLKTLTDLGGTYLSTRAQKTALQLQIEQARAGAPPLPIDMRAETENGIGVPIYTAPDGRQYPLTAELAQRLRPVAAIADYLPWVLLAGGALALVLILKRR